jgi:hypothetical protein
MNKSRQSMPVQLRKKMKKEFKTATLRPEPTLKSDRITPQQLLSRAPVQSPQKAGELKKLLKKNLNNKGVKPHASKRTTPGTAGETSSPQNVHVEGRRWIKTLGKQNTAKRKVFTRHTAKQK